MSRSNCGSDGIVLNTFDFAGIRPMSCPSFSLIVLIKTNLGIRVETRVSREHPNKGTRRMRPTHRGEMLREDFCRTTG